jgi:predicted RNA binding protein YcfA (HicA-like mRNA interferase family)
MPRLPIVSYKQLLKLFKQFGYEIDHQRGSHIRLKRELPSGHHSITIPAHKEIAKGTLSDILERLSHY